MTKTATAVAPSNIAFVKYWGKTDDALTLPQNSSISMSLDDLYTTTKVTFSDVLTADEVWIQDDEGRNLKMSGSKSNRVTSHLDRLRQIVGNTQYAKVESINTFPAGVGIASSASAFAALTLAAATALEISLNQEELSRLTRLAGSGSATRSVYGGYVEWLTGDDTNSTAVQLAPETHWQLSDVVTIVSKTEKKVSSLEGHDLAATSPYFQPRLKLLPKRLKHDRTAIATKDLTLLGSELEPEALSLHTVAMTCVPPVFYPTTETFLILDELRRLRGMGLEVYGTMDAGPNVHCICAQTDREAVAAKLSTLPYITQLFQANVGQGAKIV